MCRLKVVGYWRGVVNLVQQNVKTHKEHTTRVMLGEYTQHKQNVYLVCEQRYNVQSNIANIPAKNLSVHMPEREDSAVFH